MSYQMEEAIEEMEFEEIRGPIKMIPKKALPTSPTKEDD